MSEQENGGSRRRLWASAATAVLAVAGITALVLGFVWQQAPPQPSADTQDTQASASQSGLAAPPSKTDKKPVDRVRGPVMPASKPTSVSIPAIDVQSSLITVGQNPDGTMEVPQPGPNYNSAAWYKYSPTPGEQGPSVIIGHIDSAEKGPSVFYNLGAMQPGQKVSVTRADGSVAVFTVDRVEKYPKSDFPTLEVYGNTSRAELRLITCGGTFNEATGNYRSNIVVYAHLTETKPA